MFTPDADRHGRSQTCKKLQQKRANIEAASIQSAADNVNFTIRGEEIERVREFNYLYFVQLLSYFFPPLSPPFPTQRKTTFPQPSDLSKLFQLFQTIALFPLSCSPTINSQSLEDG